MKPKQFSETAGRRSAAIFGKDTDVRLLIDGQTEAGLQVRVYKGLLPGETLKSSIGHFLIVAAENNASRSHQEQVIAAGSLAVRHPSFSTQFGRGRWTIQSSLGIVAFPSERAAEDGAVPSINGEDILPKPEQRDAELATDPIPDNGPETITTTPLATPDAVAALQ